MASTEKPEANASKKKAGRSLKLNPKEKLTVDELCALWQRVLNYRRDLQDHVKNIIGPRAFSARYPSRSDALLSSGFPSPATLLSKEELYHAVS